jgi:predicted ester cyclase
MHPRRPTDSRTAQRITRRSTLRHAGASSVLAVVAGSITAAPSAHAAQGEADTAQLEAVVRGVIDAINANDAVAFDTWVADDLVGHFPVPLPGAGKGLAGAKENLAALHAGMSDLELSIEDIVAEGDTVVVRGVFRGTHSGTFLGVPATGATLEVPGVCIARVAEGKAVEYWSQFNQLAVLEQAGLFSLEDVTAD